MPAFLGGGSWETHKMATTKLLASLHAQHLSTSVASTLLSYFMYCFYKSDEGLLFPLRDEQNTEDRTLDRLRVQYL